MYLIRRMDLKRISMKGIIMTFFRGRILGSPFFILMISALFFLMLVFSLNWVYSSAGIFSVFNSDYLYPESLYRDAFTDHYPFSGWLVSKAPVFFPDWGLYFLIRILGVNFGAAWWLYLVVDFGLVLLIFYALISLFNSKDKSKNILYTIGWGTLFILILWGAPIEMGPHTLIVIAAHSGALLNSGIILWLWVLSLMKPFRWPGLLFLTFFCTIATMSDLWWVPWIGIPIGLTTLLLISCKKLNLRQNFYFLVALGLGTIFGELLLELIRREKWLHFSEAAVGTPGLSVLGQLKIIGRDLLTLGHVSPLWLLLFIATVSLCIIVIRSWGYPSKWDVSLSPNKTTAFVALHIAVLFSFVVPFFVIVPFRLWALWNYRYITPVLFFPWVIVGLHLLNFRSRIKYFITISLFPLILFSFLFVAQLTSLSKQYLGFMKTAPYNPTIACVDEVARANHLKIGAGEYWYAKSISNATHAGLWVNQFTYNFDVLFWVSNFYWYLNPFNHSPVQYDFVVAAPADTSWQTLQSIVGTPSAINLCNGIGMFIYTGEKRKALNQIIGSRVVNFFSQINHTSNTGSNILRNGNFDISTEAWELTAVPGPLSTFTQLSFNKEDVPVGSGLTHYAEWKVKTPVSYAFLEQRFNNIHTLARKSLTLTFWARSLSGKQTFISQGYLVPDGKLDPTAISFQSDPFVLNHHWQKITVFLEAPNLDKQKLTKNSYATIRPIFYNSSDAAKTVDIAGIEFFTHDEPVISSQNIKNYVAVDVSDVPALIAKADKSHSQGDFDKEYQYLKSAETATPDNAALLARFTNKPTLLTLSKRMQAELLWRLARSEYGFAKGNEVLGHLQLAANYAYTAYNLLPNATTIKWWAVVNMSNGSLGNIREKNNVVKQFPELITKAIAQDQKNPELYALMGKWNYDYAKANLLTRLALVLSLETPAKGTYQNARNYFEQAVHLDPNNVLYRQWLIKVDKKLGDANAIDKQQKVLANMKLPPNDLHMMEVQQFLS